MLEVETRKPFISLVYSVFVSAKKVFEAELEAATRPLIFMAIFIQMSLFAFVLFALFTLAAFFDLELWQSALAITMIAAVFALFFYSQISNPARSTIEKLSLISTSRKGAKYEALAQRQGQRSGPTDEPN